MNKNRSGLLNADLRAFTIVMENISFAFKCSNYAIVYILEVNERRKKGSKIYTFLCSIKNSRQEDVILRSEARYRGFKGGLLSPFSPLIIYSKIPFFNARIVSHFLFITANWFFFIIGILVHV